MVVVKLTGEVAIEGVGLGSAMNEPVAQAVSVNVMTARKQVVRMVCGQSDGAYGSGSSLPKIVLRFLKPSLEQM